MTDTHSSRHVLWSVIALIVLTSAAMALGLRHPQLVSKDAYLYETIAQRLVDNQTDGRQALISSMWWPPLPVLLRIPFITTFTSVNYPIPSLLISALFGAATLVLLERILAQWKVGAGRFLLVAALAGHPVFITQCSNGGSATTVMFLFLSTGYALTQWIASRKLRFLIGLAVASACLTITQTETGLWVILVFILLVLDMSLSADSRSQKGAVCILVFLPSLYVISLWVLMNWLIMGDALYFLRSVLSPFCLRRAVTTQQAAITMPDYGAALVCLLIALFSVNKRDRPGAYLGTLGIGIMALSLLLISMGLFWDHVPMLFCLLVICLMTIGYAMGPLAIIPRNTRIFVCILPLAISIAAFAQSPVRNPGHSPSGDQGPINKIEKHVAEQARILKNTRFTKVFICGYEGFALLQELPEPVFSRNLDADLADIAQRHSHCGLYLLIHKPVGKHAMDSIHWKYEGLFEKSGYGTVYDSEWGDWRLFELNKARKQ